MNWFKTILSLKIIFILINVNLTKSQINHSKEFLKNEVMVSYGFGAQVFLRPPVISNYISDNDNPYSKNPLGPIIIGYRRYLNKAISAGLQISYSGYPDIGLYSLKPGIEIHYLNTNTVNLYSGLAVGVTYYNSNNSINTENFSRPKNGGFISFHLNLFGVRIGSNFGVFTEIGLGDNGIINFGSSCRF